MGAPPALGGGAFNTRLAEPQCVARLSHARSMRLAVRGLRLVNSVVLACLARLPYRTGGHGPRESGQSRARGPRSEGPASTVRAQSIRPRLRPRCGPPVRVREPPHARLGDVRDLRRTDQGPHAAKDDRKKSQGMPRNSRDRQIGVRSIDNVRASSTVARLYLRGRAAVRLCVCAAARLRV